MNNVADRSLCVSGMDLQTEKEEIFFSHWSTEIEPQVSQKEQLQIAIAQFASNPYRDFSETDHRSSHSKIYHKQCEQTAKLDILSEWLAVGGYPRALKLLTLICNYFPD